jgi:transmembrane sensor
MKNEQAKDLWNKYLKGDCSHEESAQIESWYNDEFAEVKDIEAPDYEQLKNKMWQGIQERQFSAPLKTYKLWPRMTAAACAIILLGLGLYIYPFEKYDHKLKSNTYAHDIRPGSNKALLTLANGRKISLTDVSNGELANQSGIRVNKNTDVQLFYKPIKKKIGSKRESCLNTIETPRGGQYQVFLPDGSRVWLNASSSLKFPSSFENATQRKVMLNGQAYFEVAKDKNKAFIVQSATQNVEVLGTHFDISTYPEESTRTTLLEGSVRVCSSKDQHTKVSGFVPRILVPNQQSVLLNDAISVISVEAGDAIAWKNGKFMFNNEELESIMMKVSRWYNVEVRFANERMKKNAYWGTVSRFENVSKVLEKLELAGDVHFKIEQKTIIVLP